MIIFNDFVRLFLLAICIIMLIYGLYSWLTRFRWRYEFRVFRTVTSYVIYNMLFLSLLTLSVFAPLESHFFQ